MIRPGETIIHPGNAHLFVTDPIIDGERKTRGLIPRNYETHPVGYYRNIKAFNAVDFPLIPESEYAERIKDKVANKSQLSDVRNKGNAGQPLPSRDQNGKGYCLPPGSLIRMADGTHKRVEDIRLLDEVVSAEGNVRRVMECYVRQHDGQMAVVQCWGHQHLRLTPNHEVLTERGYIPAGELRAGDWVAVPRYAAQRSRMFQTAPHLRGVNRRVKNLAGVAQWETRLPDDEDNSVKRVPDFIELNANTGRIFGLYLAEGSARSSNELSWAFSKEEEHTLAADLVTLLQEEWGVTPLVRQLPHNVTEVRLQGVLWVQLFTSVCGRGAADKAPHADLMAGPTEFLAALFRGWMDGDGTVRGGRGTLLCGCTVSHRLAMSMYDIANHLGYRPSVLKENGQVNRHAGVRRPTWKVQVNLDPSDRRPDYRSKSDDRTVWRKVRHVQLQAYAGMVYNFAVEVDNSYVAEGIGVHNCWFHSGTSAQMLLRAVMGEPYADLSAYAGACKIKGFRDEGGWGAQGVDFQAEKGIPTSQFWPQKSMDRANDNAATWENALLHRVQEGWIDAQAAQYDRKLSRQQVSTLLLTNCPVVSDYNWWGHSVCAADLVDGVSSFNQGLLRDENGKLLTLQEFDYQWGMNDGDVGAGFGVRIWNSWGDSWSQQGMGVLTANKAWPDGAVGLRTVTPSLI